MTLRLAGSRTISEPASSRPSLRSRSSSSTPTWPSAAADQASPSAPRPSATPTWFSRKALADAERLGFVPRNAAAAAKPPTVKPVEQQTWDSDQLVQFFEHVADDRLLAVYVLAATTGMRRGEALGLRWSDVDLDGGQLAVRQTVTTVNYQPVVTTPKTRRSRRVVYLDDHTIDAMRAHRRRQVDEKKGAGPAGNDEPDLVFRDEIRDLINPDRFSREFARHVVASGLPKIAR